MKTSNFDFLVNKFLEQVKILQNPVPDNSQKVIKEVIKKNMINVTSTDGISIKFYLYTLLNYLYDLTIN